jgi:hypothetical protein
MPYRTPDDGRCGLRGAPQSSQRRLVVRLAYRVGCALGMDDAGLPIYHEDRPL